MTARFTRRARLLKPEAFKSTFERGFRIHEKGLTAVVAANTLGHPRLGLAVSKKAVPLAVDRNRMKRQIRETFRLHQTLLPANDIVVLVKPGSRLKTLPHLRQSLERLWTRIAASSAVAPSS